MTKAEQARMESERSSAREHAAARKAKHEALAARKKRPATRESTHAGRKATHALEAHAAGARPSRTSSRKGANHMKADAAFNIREETGVDAPEVRHDAARAKQTRVRGRR